MRVLNPLPSEPTPVQSMRDELTRLGFEELRTAGAVDAVLGVEQAPTLVFVNSVCGCAAGAARPAVALALRSARGRPPRLTTVFAGQDPEATERARTYFTGYEPSSPAMALLVGGRLAWMLERWQIQGRDPRAIAADVSAALERVCA